MKSGWSSFFPCPHCGSQNITGAGYCGNCGVNLYYNCPECRGWVDATFSHCPNCRAKLDWPADNAFRDERSSPAVMLLLLGIVMLATGSIYLIVNNSATASAVSGKAANSSTWAAPTSAAQTSNTLKSSASYQNSPAATGAKTAGYPVYDPAPAPGSNSPTYEVVMTIPANTAPVSETSVSSPQGRSYLDTVYPNWGHCVGGRCSGSTQ